MLKNNIAFTLLFLGIGTLPLIASAEENSSDDGQETAVKSQPASSESTYKGGESGGPNLARDAGERRTPPWTNDSANINLQQPRTPYDENLSEPYTSDDFKVKPEWEKLFADHNRFSTTTGEELYHTMCQACHMEDGQGASGAGDYPSFVGDERLRTPFYAMDVILNGFRGMPSFRDELTNQQIADVVNYLRTHFGNQLEADATADDAERVRY